MTSKSAEWSSKKGKKKNGSSKQQTVVAAEKKVENITIPSSDSDKTVHKHKKTVKSVGIYDRENEKQKKQKKKSLARKFMSLSIVAYLGYSTFYACGSPFDRTSEKPLICSAIDPIKLDIYSLFQSDYYKQHLHPYVSPVINKATRAYHDYGVPAQHQVVDIYYKHGQPNLNRAYGQVVDTYYKHGQPNLERAYVQVNHVVVPIYQNKVLPIYNQKVAPVINPYIKQAQPYLNQIKQARPDLNQIRPMYEQGVKTMYTQANEAQLLAKNKWNNLPPAAQHVKQQVLDWIDRAENTPMMPILISAYWNVIDFYQYGVIPVINHSQAVKTVKYLYNEHAKDYVNQHVVPFIQQINHQIHLDQLIAHIILFLPERPIKKEEQIFAAKTSSTQVKTTSTAVPKTQHVPITPPAASVKTVTVSSSSKTVQDTPAPASTTSIESTIVEPTLVESTHSTSQETPAKPKATIIKSAIHDIKDHIIKKVESIKPSFTHQPEPEAVVPDADKKEAIYCPTCNAEEEQLIVANTDKYVIPVRSDKHVIPVPTDNELFELHKEEIDIPVQPTTPSEGTFDTDEQIVIQAPILSKKKEEEKKVVKEEDVVFSIQTEVPSQSLKEEDIVFSIQTEEPAFTKEEDIVFSIQTETPSPSATEEEEVVFSIQTEEPAFSIQTEDEPAFSIQTEDEPVFSIQTEEPAFSIQTEAPLIKVQETEPVEENETIVLNTEDNLEQEKVQEIDQKIVEEIRHEAKKQEMDHNKKDQIFVPPAIKNEDLVLDTKKENDEPAVFVKVDEPQVEHVDHFEEPIVKVVEQEESTEEPVVVVQAEEEQQQQKSFDTEPAVKIKAPFKEPVEQ